MTLVTRVSVAFLVALALALGGFSACLHTLVGFRLRLGLDQDLETTLDGFPDRDRPGGRSGRVTWAIYDETGRRVEATPGDLRPMVLDGRDLGPLAIDVATTIEGPDRLRWRVLARRIGGGGPRHGPRDDGGRHPGTPDREERRGGGMPRERPSRVLAAWAPVGPVESEIRSLGAILALISVGLWGLAAAIGRHFARRALAPLARMAESARDSPSDDCRLSSPGTGDELEDFARSFNDLLDRRREALERQRRFAGEASHQLRTPLAALIATIDVARRRGRTVDDHERILDRLHDDSTRLWRIVEALLFLARADHDAGLPGLDRLDLVSWAAGHLPTWTGHDRAADIRFESGDRAPAWTRAHRPLLGQLLDNLLENASKYSDPGTPIVVRACSGTDGVALSVDDRGPGIEADDLPRIFDPFYRADSARRLGRAGVGLGLAVARRIAEAHLGTLTVESEPGRGSRFIVRLPSESAPEALGS